MVQLQCLNYSMKACYSNYIYGPWLPWGRNCLKSSGRGPIDPNWKCHFTGLPSWRCSHSPGWADVNSMFLLSIIVWYLNSFSTLPTSGRLGGCRAACTVSCVKPECKEAPTAVENWGHSTRVNQLEQIVLEPLGFADTCWSQHTMS